MHISYVYTYIYIYNVIYICVCVCVYFVSFIIFITFNIIIYTAKCSIFTIYV